MDPPSDAQQTSRSPTVELREHLDIQSTMSAEQKADVLLGRCGYDVVLAEGDDDRYRCRLCHRLLRRPVQAACGDRFCNACIDHLLSLSASPRCPRDSTVLTKDEIFHDVFAEREIAAIKVHCNSRRKHPGCSWIGELRFLENHEATCQHVCIVCPKCSLTIRRAEQGEHLKQVCAKRTVTCSSCHASMSADTLAEHQEVSCPEQEVNCPNTCSVMVKRKDIVEHCKSCPMQIVFCYYEPVGCSFKGPRKDLPVHHASSLAYHMQLQYERFSGHQQLVAQLQRTNSLLVQKCASLDSKVTVLSALVEKMAESYTWADLEHAQTRAMTGSKSKCQGSCTVAENEVFVDQSQGDRAPSRQSDHDEQRFCTMDKQLQIIEERLGSTDRILALHDVMLSEITLRQDVSDLKMTSGILVWKIGELFRRQREAKEGKVPSLYSPPFYTSPCGYKLAARLYPNGDGIGKGTHLSLFLVVMRGEFDSLLPWPFHQQVTLCLLDQNHSNHVAETFRPDSGSSSFQRPEEEMNVASGCPLFFPLASLTDNYTTDDTIYIKIIVNSDNLTPPDAMDFRARRRHP